MKRNTASIIFCLAALLSIVAIPVIEYIGGRLCFPLIVPPLLPAQIVPYGIWLFAVVMLIGLIVRSIKNKCQIHIPCGAFVIALVFMGLFLTSYEPMSAFLLGLKTRFVKKVGYATMRGFAEEVSKKPEGIVHEPGKSNPRYNEDQSYRKALTARYPFLGWAFGSGDVHMRDDIVQLTWGSALTGHWGFQVCPAGAVEDIERGIFLRVSTDIQFVLYED
jgi:amino acid transporter